MFEDYKKKVNKAFGIYEHKMILLSYSLLDQAISLSYLASDCEDVRDACLEVADRLKENVKLIKGAV